MKKVSYIVSLLLSFSISSAHCATRKEEKQKEANDKLQDAYVDTAIGGLEIIVGGYKMAQGDITGAFTVGDGLRRVANGVEEFNQACNDNKEAREMKEDD